MQRKTSIPGRAFRARLLLSVLLGCPSAATADGATTEALSDLDPPLTVVLVPGITGSILQHRESGRIVWGNGARLWRPRDGGRELILPLDTRPEDPTELVATGVIEEIRLAGVIRKPIYGPLLEHLEGLGFPRGDPSRPRPGDRLFAFAYDWRRDLVVTVRSLAETLAAIRRRQRVDRLRIALICQSNGGQICRYLARYGAHEIASAERGGSGPRQLEITDLFLVGSANGGSLRNLRELDRGRRYLGRLGRAMRPEVIFSFPSVLQELPLAERDLLLDSSGAAIDAEIGQAATWERLGWSVFDPEISRRSDRLAPLGTAESRSRYLQSTLDRARHLQDLLAHDIRPLEGTRIHLIGGSHRPTPVRALVRRESGGGWGLLFVGDGEIDESPRWKDRLGAAGDGHASLSSLASLSPSERSAVVGQPYLAKGGHFEIILDPGWWSLLSELLVRTSP